MKVHGPHSGLPRRRRARLRDKLRTFFPFLGARSLFLTYYISFFEFCELLLFFLHGRCFSSDVSDALRRSRSWLAEWIAERGHRCNRIERLP